LEFSWPIFVTVMVANTLAMGAIYVVAQLDKSLPPWNSKIPGTEQKFLAPWGFWTMTYGDLLAIPLVFNAFSHLVVADITNLWLGLIIGDISGIGFTVMCLGKRHKPDYGFPQAGKVSVAGLMHSVYFGAGFGAVAVCLWHLFVTGNLPWLSVVTWVALVAIPLYVPCVVLDFTSGNFDPLEQEEGK